MNLYKLEWVQPGAGAYIPEDPCVSSGGYRGDLVGAELVPASTMVKAREYFTNAWPQRKIKRVKIVGKDITL